MKTKIVLILLLLIPSIILFPHLCDFIFQISSIYSDIAVTHYPNGVFIQSSIRAWGEIPLWSPTILSGSPFIANPLSGLHYPPGWLAYLFVLPLGFNIMVILHLFWGGLGFFLFLRQEGLSSPASLFGALTFEAMPKIFGHLGAGHLTLIYAICWTPWLLYFDRRYQCRLFKWIGPGMVLGIIVLADIRWSAYSGLLWMAYTFRGSISGANSTGRLNCWMRPLLIWGASRITNLTICFMFAAPLLLPFLEFLNLSSRNNLTTSDNLTLSLPPTQLMGLLFPNIGGPAEWITYPGAAILLLTFFIISKKVARANSFFWLGIICVAFFLSLGSTIPFLEMIYKLPGLNWLRVPPRALIIAGFGFSVVSAIALEEIMRTQEITKGNEKDWSGLVIFALTIFSILLTIGVMFIVDNALVKIQFLWGTIAIIFGFLLIWLARIRYIHRNLFYVLFTSVLLIDMIGVNALSLRFSSSKEILTSGQNVVDFIKSRTPKEHFRLYSPSYSIPQHLASINGLELADGVDPLQLISYVKFMERATGVPSNGYSVTIPPFSEGSPDTDNAPYIPDTKLLGLLNVKYVVSEFTINDRSLILQDQIGRSYIYKNSNYLPRSWVQPEEGETGHQIYPAEIIIYQPNEIHIRAQGPGLLVLSELNYPGWKVEIDQSEKEIVTVNQLFRGVHLPLGIHTVVFSFKPSGFLPGLFLCTTACLLLLLFSLIVIVRGH